MEQLASAKLDLEANESQAIPVFMDPVSATALDPPWPQSAMDEHRATRSLRPGRWTIRITITADGTPPLVGEIEFTIYQQPGQDNLSIGCHAGMGAVRLPLVPDPPPQKGWLHLDAIWLWVGGKWQWAPISAAAATFIKFGEYTIGLFVLALSAFAVVSKIGNNIVDIPWAHTCFMETPNTLRDAMIWFADFEHCRQFMIELRWADGVVKCPRCGSDNVTYLEKARVWKCYAKHPSPTFTLKTGTIFEDSPIGLEKWLPAAWLIVGAKNGISSYELHRGLGVTQKTAWFMLHRIRLAMQDGGFNMLAGEIEVDETFIGGKARNMHKAKRAEKIQGRGADGKEIVFGMVERGGKVVVDHVEKRTKRELQTVIREHVEAGAAIFSDELLSYDGLEADYRHAVINHAVEYVNGNVHTNTMENFWSLLKRGLHGTYISVEPFHLFRYLDEQAFRYNNRKATDAERFAAVMKQVVGRRVTYAELTDKTQEAGR